MLWAMMTMTALLLKLALATASGPCTGLDLPGAHEDGGEYTEFAPLVAAPVEIVRVPILRAAPVEIVRVPILRAAPVEIVRVPILRAAPVEIVRVPIEHAPALASSARADRR